ncbi:MULTISPECIES: ribosomal protein S18-alanine N-acetyltransferase [unclassified Vibrio]|uniref:[Ribosomal protein bS18]-alanine N-acetyltransferase n=1 Tax=Vibrio sp. HB236076 TaxID=3232307 RepID=A0AB39HEC0_9VIBR|nr:ribosomal protein S18-alanine N-acetyltransferase [Vibrio sp. HB161653]MDP5254059.1 ribosomal protein S18-alanine N-acetyltransferase [Vibrio sp. HB161653]
MIRPLTAHDITWVEAIEQQVHLSPWSYSTLSKLDGRGAYHFGYFEQEKGLGYCYSQCIAGEVHLHNLAVAKVNQGQGIASCLLSALITQAKSLNADSIWLEVRVSNLSAQALYHKFDFSEVTRRENYYPAKQGYEDALIMCLTL